MWGKCQEKLKEKLGKEKLIEKSQVSINFHWKTQSNDAKNEES